MNKKSRFNRFYKWLNKWVDENQDLASLFFPVIFLLFLVSFIYRFFYWVYNKIKKYEK